MHYCLASHRVNDVGPISEHISTASITESAHTEAIIRVLALHRSTVDRLLEDLLHLVCVCCSAIASHVLPALLLTRLVELCDTSH